MSAEKLLDRLDKVRAAGAGRWMAACPGHEDRTPSLSIRELEDGRILLHCFAGCGASDILVAVGLSLADLFPKKLEGDFSQVKNAHAHAAGAALKSLDHDALLIALAAEAIAKNQPLDEEDRKKIILAAERIRATRLEAAR